MASNIDFVLFVCEQCRGAGDVTFKKMFGEYALYCGGKSFGLICNDTVFINSTENGQRIMGDKIEWGIPYNGAKPKIVVSDLDNAEFLAELVKATCEQLPFPKAKKKKI